MKHILQLIVFAVFTLSVTAKEASLEKGQVIKIAEIILQSKAYKKQRESYTPEKATYDPKTGEWSVEVSISAMPVFPGSPIRFFYIRDSDRKYRIGSISGSGYSPRSSAHYSMSPALRKKIKAVE